MRLKNKRTGEIGEIGYIGSSSGKLTVKPINGVACESIASYASLAELNADWEDYEESKEYWIIDTILHEIRFLPYKNNEEDKRYEQWLEELGLKFETKEEAEKAVERLRAWKRLKDKGFRFTGEGKIFRCIGYEFDCDYCLIAEDCRLLFGGKE